VSIAVNGPIYSMFMCSCQDCQKATGTGHSAVAIVDPADVTIDGITKSFARSADSGATFTRTFCPECGTPLFGKSSRAPDAIMLPIGLFGADAPWLKPNQLIFSRSHRAWDTVAEDLPQHQTYRQRGGQ
jgi:hypothetical protein